MSVGYTAYVLDAKSRQKILEIFASKYADVKASHITHFYGATEADVPAQPHDVKVTGYHDSGAMQVLCVEIDGEKFQKQRSSSDPKNYLHITLSLDRSQGVSPRNANDMLEKIRREKGEKALHNLDVAIAIKVTPQLLKDTPAQVPPPRTPTREIKSTRWKHS